MATTGIRRKVDDLGRVVIPASIRRTLGIREGDALEISVEDDRVVLSKPQDRCVFCRAEEDLQDYRGKAICRACVASLGVLDERLRLARQVEERRATTPATGLPPWDVGSDRIPASVATRDEVAAAQPPPRPSAPPAVPPPARSVPPPPEPPPASTTAW